jgi:Na+/pantothenate symporter
MQSIARTMIDEKVICPHELMKSAWGSSFSQHIVIVESTVSIFIQIGGWGAGTSNGIQCLYTDQ